MKDWIVEVAKLLGHWDKVAANTALVHLDHDGDKSAEEMLMGYAIAERIFGNVFVKYARQKDTLSDEDEENLQLAIQLARRSIPKGHPLLYVFLKEASFLKDELIKEVEALERELGKKHA